MTDGHLETREILVVGLNPAFQTTLHFDAFRPGKVNRAQRKCHSIGGKGQNFAIACEQYGEKDRISILQFLGGRNGVFIQSVLQEKGIHQICGVLKSGVLFLVQGYLQHGHAVSVALETRQCTTVLDRSTGSMTELIEPPGRVTLQERDTLEALSKDLLQSPRLDGVALCGSLPAGITGSTFTHIAENKKRNTLLFLDACKDIDCLKTGKVDILKVNSEEAAQIAHMPDGMDLQSIGQEIMRHYRVKIIAITNGPDEALLLERKSSDPHNLHVTTFTLPDLVELIERDALDLRANSDTESLSASLPEATGDPAMSLSPDFRQFRISSRHQTATQQQPAYSGLLLNPLGAGDTCSGVFFVEYLDTRDAPASFGYGLAAASASCLFIDSTSHFSRATMKVIHGEIVMDTRVVPWTDSC